MLDAHQVAARLHAHLTRKGTGIPDLSHLFATCSITMALGANQYQAIAALLHDAIEDVEPVELARAELGRFGPEVLRIVEAAPTPTPMSSYCGATATTHTSSILTKPTRDPVRVGVRQVQQRSAIVTDLHRKGRPSGTSSGRRARTNSGATGGSSTRSGPTPRTRPDLIAELDRTVTEMERPA
jgi:HD domain